MRIRIEVNPRELSRIIRILNDHQNEKVLIKSLLVELLRKKVSSSDYFFILLSKLQELGLVRGKYGFLFIKEPIERETSEDLIKEVVNEILRKRKIFVTPLEVAKFYQCPRRFYLEKVVMSRQFKKEKGKIWDGEALHLAVQMFINNLTRRRVEELILEIPKLAINKFRGKITIDEKDIREFLIKLYRLIEEENFNFLVSERTLVSIKRGLIGTPDIIASDGKEFVPIDVKFGRIDKKGIKKEHLLQNIGEALLVEDFLRSKIEKCYLIYFQASSVVKVKIAKNMKKEFIFYKKELERTSKRKNIPSRSRLPNAKVRVCKGCHVKPACDNIEELFRLGR